jgi:GntR family transcriptional regulator
MTVRHAISGLVSGGLLYRRHGKGTFVGDPKVTRRFAKLTGFSEDVVARKHRPGVRTLALRKLVTPPEAAQALGLKAHEDVVLVHRLRLVDDRPAAIQRSYLVAELVPGLENMDEEFPSLYQLLRARFRLTLNHADQLIEARQATAAEAHLLNIAARAPVVQVVRTTFLDDGRPVELARMVYRADLFEFHTRLWVDVDAELSRSPGKADESRR